MITGADQGRDVWLTRDELPVGLVQCKRVQRGFSAPDAIREVIKFLLFAELEPALLPDPTGFRFTLALSADPSGHTTSLFQSPKTWLRVNDGKINQYVEAVKAKYAAFAKLDVREAMPRIKSRLFELRYRLLRPIDLDSLLEGAPSVRRRFFKVHLVIGVDEARVMIEAKLAAAGLPPIFAMPTSTEEEIVKGSRFLADWPQHIWGKHIDRCELRELRQRIEANNAGSTLVIGGAGTGKSALLSELYRVLRESGQAVLAIKADALSTDVTDFPNLARELSMTGPIEEQICALASKGPVTLIIDQLDAVSEVMDQSSRRMQVLLRLATRLQAAKDGSGIKLPIHIVVSSRPFEAKFDARFCQLNADEIPLSLPSSDQVSALLRDLGIDDTAVPEMLGETLRTPFALGLFVDLVKAGAEAQELTPSNLLDRWLDKKLPSGEHRGNLLAFLRRLAADMTKHETLWRPATNYEPEDSGPVRAAEAVGLIVRDGTNIGFNHQSWLDDFQAKAFQTGEDLANFAWLRQDGLFAPGTVLRGLEHFRRNDALAYSRALDLLLRDPRTRRHLRHLAVDFLSSEASPSAREIAWIEWLVRNNDLALTNRALSKISSKWKAWREGIRPLFPVLMQDEQYRWNAATLLIHEAAEDPSAVMDLVDRYWPSKVRDIEVFHILERSAIISQRGLDRARAILGRTLLNDFSISHYATALHDKGHADIAIGLIATWAKTQTEDRSQSIKVYGLEKVAEASPLVFAEVFLPWFVTVANNSCDEGRSGRRYPYSQSLSWDWKYERGQGHIATALRSSLASSACKYPKETRELLKNVMDVEIDEVQSLIADTFADNPGAFNADAFTFLCEDIRRLDLGVDTFDDQESTSHLVNGWSTKNLIAQILPFLSNEEVATLRDRIENWVAWGKELTEEENSQDPRQLLRWTEEERLRLLVEFPQFALTPRRRRQVAEWKATQPKLSERPTGLGMAKFIGSPMSQEQMANAKDDDIFRMLNEIHDGADRRRHPRHRMLGGVVELSRAFSEFAKADSKRAISIIRNRLQAGQHEEVTGAAIRELAQVDTQDAFELKALIWELHERGFASDAFRNDVAAAFGTIAGKTKGLEACDIDLLRSWLQRNSGVLEEQARKHAENHRINRERNEKPDQNPSPILFGRGGGLRIITQDNFAPLMVG